MLAGREPIYVVYRIIILLPIFSMSMLCSAEFVYFSAKAVCISICVVLRRIKIPALEIWKLMAQWKTYVSDIDVISYLQTFLINELFCRYIRWVQTCVFNSKVLFLILIVLWPPGLDMFELNELVVPILSAGCDSCFGIKVNLLWQSYIYIVSRWHTADWKYLSF